MRNSKRKVLEQFHELGMTIEDLPEVFLKSSVLLYSKSQDYNGAGVALDDPRSEYFPFGSESYGTMLWTKAKRLVSLITNMKSGRSANFEGIDDTLLDICNYSAFFYADIRDKDELESSDDAEQEQGETESSEDVDNGEGHTGVIAFHESGKVAPIVWDEFGDRVFNPIFYPNLFPFVNPLNTILCGGNQGCPMCEAETRAQDTSCTVFTVDSNGDIEIIPEEVEWEPKGVIEFYFDADGNMSITTEGNIGFSTIEFDGDQS